MPLSALPFLLIPYDSLTHLVGLDPGETSQSLPATAVFSLAYLVLRKGRIRLSPTGRAVLQYLAAAVACILVVTLANVVIEAIGLQRADVGLRVSTAFRQGISLALGFTTFLMFEDAMTQLGTRAACRWIVVGTVPSVIPCAIQLLSGSYRLQGFSSEPSLLGDMLVLSFLPACLYAGLRAPRRLASLAGGSIALVAAFSGTAIMKAIFAVIGYSAVKGKFLRGALVGAVVLAIVYGILSLYPDNYIFNLIGLFSYFLDSGNLIGGSFIDRFFGFVGPLGTLAEPRGWLGLGLGGDSVYFYSFFDPATAESIREQKAGVPSISSLQAKMLLYGGVTGYAFYLAAWYAAWRASPRNHPARFMIPTVFAASVFSLGPLFLPYAWLWLAFGATATATATATLQTPGRRPTAVGPRGVG